MEVHTAEAGGELFNTSRHASSRTGAEMTIRDVLAERREVVNCEDN